MNFEWGLFMFTMTDCKRLIAGLKASPTLNTLRVTSSKIGEQEGRMLVKGLLEHPRLTVLGIYTHAYIYMYITTHANIEVESYHSQISHKTNWAVVPVVLWASY